jgi:hypothetical protein
MPNIVSNGPQDGADCCVTAGNVLMALLQVVLTRLPVVSYHFQVRLASCREFLINIMTVMDGMSSMHRQP